jgi:hypothetical protein
MDSRYDASHYKKIDCSVGLETQQREAFTVYTYLNIFSLLCGQQQHTVHLEIS